MQNQGINLMIAFSIHCVNLSMVPPFLLWGAVTRRPPSTDYLSSIRQFFPGIPSLSVIPSLMGRGVTRPASCRVIASRLSRHDLWPCCVTLTPYPPRPCRKPRTPCHPIGGCRKQRGRGCWSFVNEHRWAYATQDRCRCQEKSYTNRIFIFLAFSGSP